MFVLVNSLCWVYCELGPTMQQLMGVIVKTNKQTNKQKI